MIDIIDGVIAHTKIFLNNFFLILCDFDVADFTKCAKEKKILIFR